MDEVLDAPATPAVIPTSIAEYSPTAAALADLAHRFRGVVFDVTTTKGNADARAARLELVKLRTSLEAKRKEIKAPALERARLIDAEATKIASAIAELEVPIDEQIKADERRREAEKQAKVEAEARRVAEIRERIQMIGAVAMRAAGQPSASIEEKIKLTVALVIKPEGYAEFVDEATAVHAATLASLREMHAAALVSEAEAARIAAERIELDRLRAEDAERRRVEQERADAARRAEAESLAEQRRQLAADEAAAAERRRKDDEAAAAVRAEADRVAREEREAARRQQEEQARAERAALEAEQTRMAEERAELQRQQEERDAAEREANRVRVEAEHARLVAEAAARTKLQAAAQLMLDALRQWANAEKTKDKAELANARKARDEAIAAAT